MDYAAFLHTLILDLPAPNEAMHRLSHYVVERDETADHGLWTTVREVDWSPHVKIVERWFHQGLHRLAAEPSANLLYISLGDYPEVFSFEGVPLPEGQKASDRIIEALRENDWTWFDAMSPDAWDNSVELAFHETSELPGPIQMMEAGDAGYTLWQTLASLAVLHGMQSFGAKESTLLGPDRRALPLLIGFEDAPFHIATLTQEGWQKPAGRERIHADEE